MTLTFLFSGANGIMAVPEILTAGMVGKSICFEFTKDWDCLTKTLVYMVGEVIRAVPYAENGNEIPADVMTQPGKRLFVGVFGENADGTLVIPTIFAKGPIIQSGADLIMAPINPEPLAAYVRIMAMIGDLSELQTVAKESIVAAINELTKTDSNEHTAELSITGFTRYNGTFSTSASGKRTDYISTENVRKISVNLGYYGDAANIAFFDAGKAFLADISVIGTAVTIPGSAYGEGAYELDISGSEYAEAAYFVVSSYRGTAYTGYKQTFADDYCKYITVEEVTVEDAPAYRISEQSVDFFGDSITAGAGDGDYPSMIAEETGAKVTNLGVSGSTLASGTTSTHHICEDVAAYTGNADIICISGGQNDFNQSVPLGELTDGYAAELDTTTVIGALESIIRHLLTNHTSAKLYYIITHKAASAEVNANSLGLTLTDYHDAIVSVLRKYSIPYYDAFLHSGFVTSKYGEWGETIRNLYTVGGDGIHPNRAGYEKYYLYQIIEMLESGIGSGGSDTYSRSEIDTMLGSYITDIDTLIGGDA